jgi:hypothetical protein
MPTLAERMRAARRITVEVEPGKRIHLLRPREQQCLEIWRQATVTPDDVCAAAEGWDGYTEADLLGPELGASDPVPFARDVFEEFVRDRVDLLGRLAGEISKSITEHFAKRAAAEKN